MVELREVVELYGGRVIEVVELIEMVELWRWSSYRGSRVREVVEL